MDYRSYKEYGNVIVAQRSDYLWGILDHEGNEIVPFGKYGWIDGFDQGLARVRTLGNSGRVANKWGIINEQGEEVLPVEYDEVWNFLGKNRFSTKVVMNGESHEVFFHDLNPSLPLRGQRSSNRSYDAYEGESRTYDEFAGSYAQDVMGYSDEEIYDAFDGEPDAYWNID